MTPQDIVNNTEEDSGGLTLPGWEPGVWLAWTKSWRSTRV